MRAVPGGDPLAGRFRLAVVQASRGAVPIPYAFISRAPVPHVQEECVTDGGTVMQSSHTPLSTWFWGAYLMTTQTPGLSAVQFQRQLRLTRYETAFQILHKLRAGMVRPERDPIGAEHPVEIDECFVGGVTRGEGKGAVQYKTIVAGAVEVRRRQRDGKVHKRKLYAGRLRLATVADRSAKS